MTVPEISRRPALSGEFQDAASSAPISNVSTRKASSPFSIRLTLEERAFLESAAGPINLGAYIRQKLFAGANLTRGSRRKPKRLKKPKVDQPGLAAALAALGQSRLAANLNQIAKAANMGALPVSPELCAELEAACADVAAMRAALMRALGLKEGESS